MKAAFSVWNNRIAPVFDVAGQIHIVEVEAGRIIRETQEVFPEEIPVRKALRLVELDVGALVCGAISLPMHAMVVEHGIWVIPFAAGNVHDVIHAWLSGSIWNTQFSMPGCRGRGLRFRGMHGIDQGEPYLSTRPRGRREARGRWGRGGQNPDRIFAQFTVGARGWYMCPRCGYRELHEPGVSRAQRRCSRCGAAMKRQ